MQLTDRQTEVLNFIKRFTAERGFPPTRADISEAIGCRSANTAEEHLQALKRKGVIELTRGVSRGIRVCKALTAV